MPPSVIFSYFLLSGEGGGGWPLGVTGLHPLDGECSFVSGSNYVIKDIHLPFLSVGSIMNGVRGKKKKMHIIIQAILKKAFEFQYSRLLNVLRVIPIHPTRPSNHHAS